MKIGTYVGDLSNLYSRWVRESIFTIMIYYLRYR